MTILAKIRGHVDKIASESQVSRKYTHLHGPRLRVEPTIPRILNDPHANHAKSNRSTVTHTRVRDKRSLLMSAVRHHGKLFEYRALYGHGLASYTAIL